MVLIERLISEKSRAQVRNGRLKRALGSKRERKGTRGSGERAQARRVVGERTRDFERLD